MVSIHLPQVEAALSAFLARLAGRKPLITYHCDLQMPPVWYGKIIDRLTFWDNLVAGKLADTIVAYTQDFAEHSPFLSRFLGAPDTETGRHGDGETWGHGDTGASADKAIAVSPRRRVAASLAKCVSSSRPSSSPTRRPRGWPRCASGSVGTRGRR